MCKSPPKRISRSYYPGGLRLSRRPNCHQHHCFSDHNCFERTDNNNKKIINKKKIIIIIAVKGNHRLKNKSNIALACLSTTDLVMGLIGQPAFVSWMIAHLQRNNTSVFSYCIRAFSSTIPLRVLGNASL